MAMNVTPFVGTDNFNMETFNNMISQINDGVNSEISDVLAQLDTKAKIQTGSYVGTGTYGEGNPCSLTFDKLPDILIIEAYLDTNGFVYGPLSWSQHSTTSACGVTFPKLLTNQYNGDLTIGKTYDSRSPYTKVENNTIYWYHPTRPQGQLNEPNRVYYYMTIG